MAPPALALRWPGFVTSGQTFLALGPFTVRHASAWPPRFATQERNALLLYNGRFNEKHDFIALEIVEEQVQLTFSAGRASFSGGGGSPRASRTPCRMKPP